MGRKTKILLRVLAAIVLAVGAVIVIQIVRTQSDTDKTESKSLAINYQEKVKELNSESADTDIETIVKEYGQSFDTSFKDITDTKPNEWTPELVDKAHISLLYADKIESYTQVLDIISKIDDAKRQGVDVDNNTAKIDQARRDEIKQRAETAQDTQSRGGAQ